MTAPTSADAAPDGPIPLDRLRECFEGGVPVVLCTAAADGTPNVTYISKIHAIDDHRIALSNQFLSKSWQNLVENPRASVLVVEPSTQDEYRLTLVYERTERRGPVFEQLRVEVDTIAAMMHMQDVFRLQAADIYRVIDIEAVRVHGGDGPVSARPEPTFAAVAELGGRLSRCGDLDTLVRTCVDGLAELLDYEHTTLLLLDERGERLFTIASHGYDAEGVGSEVEVGDGLVGTAARQCAVVRVGNLRQMQRYAQRVRSGFEAAGAVGPGHEIPRPHLAEVNTTVAVPAMTQGRLVAMLVVESTRTGDFADAHVDAIATVATLVAASIDGLRVGADSPNERSGVPSGSASARVGPAGDASATTHVRFFTSDGSTFLDGDYLIKGVAGRLLWTLLRQHEDEGRVDFTNREVRLDPSLDLPEFRDNFESRLILLKRRLDERDAPIRIEKTGRGRFRLAVHTTLRLDARET